MLPFLILFMLYTLVQAIAASSGAESIAPSNDLLLWGPYRPNLYFGLRPRIPNSLLVGLMWANADKPSHIPKSRHS